MEVNILRSVAVETFKTLNEINASYIFVTQSLRSLGPKTWNNLPSNIKLETSFPWF